MNADQKSLETVFLIAICQMALKNSVSNVFYLPLLIVLMFLIAAYQVLNSPLAPGLSAGLTVSRESMAS